MVDGVLVHAFEVISVEYDPESTIVLIALNGRISLTLPFDWLMFVGVIFDVMYGIYWCLAHLSQIWNCTRLHAAAACLLYSTALSQSFLHFFSYMYIILIHEVYASGAEIKLDGVYAVCEVATDIRFRRTAMYLVAKSRRGGLAFAKTTGSTGRCWTVDAYDRIRAGAVL